MTRTSTSEWRVLSVVLACALALGGCVGAMAEDLDPATSLGDEEWSDEGPPEGEEAEDAPAEEVDPDLGTLSSALTTTGSFQLPFPCGQVWAGQTRTNHSPVSSIDFNRANDIGDSVVAAAAGTVTRVGNEGSRSYGRWIEIDHGNGYRTRYAHLHSQVVGTGQRVARGQRIGTVGDTGGSSGPHLHYELRRNGVAIRPVFDGRTAVFFGTRNYTSQNGCGGGGGGGSTTGVVGRVNTSGAPLTVRSGAGTGYRAVGSVADGAQVRIRCQKRGTSVTGTYGTSTLWDYIGTGYVADAYISTGSDGQVAPTCR
ncbi:MAG: peptidoglycan DD-metalloendopeptidase family protein [Myxococcota bacterium]|nr:peptidoglycan DD-metalloendopeptidase family protein [Myxococcota bacterium]